MRLLTVLLVVFQSLLSPLLQGWTPNVYAGREQNDVAGYARTDFLTNLAGISSGTNYVHNPVSPGTVTSDGSLAMVITSEANPTNYSAWNTLNITYSGSAPEYQIMNCSDVFLDSIPLLYGGPVNLNTSPYASEPCLKAKVLFGSGTEIDDITLSRVPETVILLDLGVLTGNTVAQTVTVTAGECVMYQVRWSASYYDNPNTALYVQLPYLSGSSLLNTGFNTGTITNSYNQFGFSNLQAPFISNNGLWNSGETAITLSGGLIVPPKSVYRQPDSGDLGSTHLYTFQLCTDRGMQTGIEYTMIAGIQGQGTDIQLSNSVSTTIVSTPTPTVSCSSDKQYLLQMLNNSKIVEYTFSVGHRDSSTEDLFSPVISLNYNDVVNDMVTACGITASDARARISVPAGFSVIDSINNTSAKTETILYTPNPLYYSVNTLGQSLYNQQTATGFIYTGMIDYDGCNLNMFSGRVVVEMQAINYSTAKTGHCDVTNYTLPVSNASVGDYVRYDEDRDGLQGSTETGVSGVNVALKFCDSNSVISGQLFQTGITDNSGNYLFTNLPAPAQYQLLFQLPDPNMSGFIWTTQSVGTASGSDANHTGQVPCFTVLANEEKRDIDAGVIIPLQSTGVSSIQGWYNKCMFTNTTDESRYNHALLSSQHNNGNIAGSLIRETNWENILSNQIGFYDNDCLDTYGANDRNSHSTYVEVNANNPTTFYHLNYHGDLPVTAQLYAKQGVWSIDRINELYTIQGVDIWTNEGTTLTNTQWSEDNSTSRASRWCHTDTGTVAPAINTGVLNGTMIPSAGDIGTGWSTICDSNSRWVVSYMQCINSLYAPAQNGICVGAPSRYQFRINVTPTQASDMMCVASATTSVAIPNTSYVYLYSNNNGSGGDTTFLYNVLSGGFVGTADQQSYITRTSPDLLLTGGSIFQQIYGPTILPAGTTGQYMYVWQNYSTVPASGTISVNIPLIGGTCPFVTNVTSGFAFDSGTCTIQGTIGVVSTGGTVVSSCEDILGFKIDSVYNASGVSVGEMNYWWSTNYYENTDRTEFIFNNLGEKIGSISYIRDGTNRFKDYSRIHYYGTQYFNLYTEQYFDVDGSVSFGFKRDDPVFNNDGNLLSAIAYNWDAGDGIRKRNHKQDYVYDTFGNQVLFIRTNRNATSSSWVNNTKVESTYDSNNNQILVLNYSRNTISSVWVPTNKNEKTYDSNNNITSTISYTRNAAANIWIPTSKNESVYDSNSNQISSISYTGSNIWTPTSKYESVYDSNNNRISAISYTRNAAANIWIPTSKNELVYDSNNNATVFLTYNRNLTGTVWLFNRKTEYSYDSNNNQISAIAYAWNMANNVWFKIGEDKYVYDTNNNKISTININTTCTSVPQSAFQNTMLQWDVFAPSNVTGDVLHTANYSLQSACNTLTGASNKSTNIIDTDLTTSVVDFSPQTIFFAPNTNPDLITHKYLDKEIISVSGEINYTIQIINTGDGLAEEIFITDVLPEGTELVSVTTSGGVIPASTNGQSYNLQTISGGTYKCESYNGQSCNVYFSAAGLTPALITVNSGYSASYILNNFTLGVEGGGVWTPDAPVTNINAKYVSVRIPALQPGQNAIIQIKVKNTINLRGDVIRNIAATIANNLLQSLSNTVYTTLLPYEPNTVAGVVYHDANANYSKTTGESVFSGVTVWLYSGDDLIGIQTTNEQGEYLFDGLPDGTYEVRYDPTTVPGYSPFAVNTGTVDGTSVGATSGLTTITTIVLAGGDDSIENNFGLVQLNTLAGVVYHDANRNYTNTTGEGLFSGVTVTLYSGSTVIATTTTNSSGAYLFTGLVNGTYEVRYDPTTVPGYVPFAVNTGMVEGTPIGIASGLTTITTITLLGGDESIENNFGLVKVISGGGGSSSVLGTNGGGSSGGGISDGGISGGNSTPNQQSTPQTQQQENELEIKSETPEPLVEETMITLPFKFLQPKEFLPTGIKDIYDDLLLTKGLKTYVNTKDVNTSAPAWFMPGRDEEAGKELSYWESIVPQTEWTKYYLPAEAILAIPSQGIVLPINYPTVDGVNDPNDEVAHLKYLDYGAVQRAGSAYLGSDAGPILIEGHSASLVTNNVGPFGAAMKATLLVNEGEMMYAFVKGNNATYTKYVYQVTKKVQVNPDDTDIMSQEKPGTLFISACGDDKLVGTLKSRNILVASLLGEAGVEMDIIIPAPVYDEEMEKAYTWAKEEGVTTQLTIQDARMYETLTRGELAKMMVEWRKGTSEGSREEVEGSERNGCTAETYGDYASADAETQQFMLEACTMGLMGRDGQGGTTKTFRWADGVSRAEFGTVLSRVLRGTQYDRGGENWYAGHLEALKAAGIMTKIDTPMMQEIRGYVMIMLMRVE